VKNSQPSESWVGRSFEVDIEKVAHGGIFVARHEGRVVFVSHVLPGERVKVRVYEDRSKGFCRAEPIKLITTSPDRVEHVWPEAAYDSEKNLAGAGGAEFGHIKLERQRELKADVIEEALQRMAGVTLRPTVEAAPGDDAANGLGYRTRVQLHVNEYGDVGPYRERTHEVVRVASLPLANEDIQELEMQNRNYQGVSKIEVAASSTGQTLIKVDSKLSSTDRLVERAGGRTFRITPGGFWQVHKRAPEVLTSAVNAAISAVGIDKDADNLDLYGGVGLFAGTMAAKFGADLRCTTVEAYKQATEDATLNLNDLPRVKAVCQPTERFLNERASEAKAEAKKAKADGLAAPKSTATVVLDPPRAGAGAHVIQRLTEIAPKHIVYVACDPIALARDLKPLLAEGYELKSLRAFDLFPHTHHVECVASLVRKDA
jgi:tRNA/tmRNA/rRNA uracil-C5-methylase (TrmA/RlmC/RlmD family)